MASDGHDDNPSAHPPAADPMGQPHLRVVPGGNLTGRPGRTGRLHGSPPTHAHAGPGPEPTPHPWFDPDAQHGPWTPDQVRAELQAFYSSPTGRFLSTEQRLGLTDLLLDERSQVAFDGYCGLFFPGKVLHPDLPERLPDTPIGFLRQLPIALRAWVRHCHRYDPWVDAEMTVAVLDGIDDVEPVWHDAVAREDRRRRSDRPFLLARLAEYAADVGGEGALWSLDAEPLPVEELQLDGLDPDTALIVVQASELCDAVFRFDWCVELRTVARRLLVRLGREAPAALRRPSVGSIAAGVSYIAVHANLAPKRGGWFSTDTIALFAGTSASGVPSRARKLLTVLDIEQHPVDEDLPPRLRRRMLRVGTPELLISQRRESLIGEAGYVACRLSDSDDGS
jgi:hypothetical protein